MGRPRQSHDSRQRLLDEGLKTLLERGYNGTGIQEVVQRAGVPKGSFYNYFESKEQFAALLIERYAAQLLERMDTVFAGAGRDSLGAVRRYFDAAAAQHAKSGVKAGCLLCNLGAEIGGQSALCQAGIRRGIGDQQKRLAALLAKAQADGKVRRDITASELAQYLLDAWHGALLRMKAEGSLQSLARFTKIHLAIIA